MDVLSVKKEELDENLVEERFLAICGEVANGVSDAHLISRMPDVDVVQRATCINTLLTQGKIELLKSGDVLLYKVKKPQSSDTIAELKGADQDEQLVYQIIEKSGNRGIWNRDIRQKSNLPLTQINKLIRVLEGKRLIKGIKSVAAHRKKVYMLQHVEPHRSVTGGPWYSDDSMYDSEYVGVISQQCLAFLEARALAARSLYPEPAQRKNASYTSSTLVWEYVNSLKLSRIELDRDDIDEILQTLVYDGKLEKITSPVAGGDPREEQESRYRYSPRYFHETANPMGLARVPCGLCPVFHKCYDRGEITPAKCQYIKDWTEAGLKARKSAEESTSAQGK